MKPISFATALAIAGDGQSEQKSRFAREEFATIKRNPMIANWQLRIANCQFAILEMLHRG